MVILEIIVKSLMAVALAIAIWRHNVLKNGTQSHFIYYLTTVIVIEIGASLCLGFFGNNVLIYNFSDLFTGFFFCFWFYRILNRKIWVLVLVPLLFISLIVSLILENWLKDYNVIFLFCSTITLLILVFRFYIEFLNRDEIIDFKKNARFWITTGVLIYFLGYLPVQVSMSKVNGNLADILYTVIAFLNIPLYGCIIIALLCPQKN